MSSWRHLPYCHTFLTQFPQLWFENHLGAGCPSAASRLAPITLLHYEAFWVPPVSPGRPCQPVLHKHTEHTKEITDSVPFSSPVNCIVTELFRNLKCTHFASTPMRRQIMKGRWERSIKKVTVRTQALQTWAFQGKGCWFSLPAEYRKASRRSF